MTERIPDFAAMADDAALLEQRMRELYNEHGDVLATVTNDPRAGGLLDFVTATAFSTEACQAWARGDFQTGNEHLARANRYLDSARDSRG
ncbi:MAG: hypothetical protein GEU98_29435 [Pseudonocardiaceae bacterium]|nr:hypothetical protein [Pseudonocardiaceae bacterium]